MVEPTSLTPAVKRKRNDLEVEEQGSALQAPQCAMERSTDFWFEDGSVVLKVEGKAQFRVHRGILRSKSAFFSEFLASRSTTTEVVEQCPVVDVRGFKKDWDHFLTFVYKSPPKLKREKSHHSFEFLASTLRLAVEYKFLEIREEALECLSIYIPKKEAAEQKAWIQTWTAAWSLAKLVDFIHLAIELKVQSILPLLYYACATHYSVNGIMKGVTLPGTNVIRSLTPAAQYTVLAGRDNIRVAAPRDILGWLFDPQVLPTKDCPSVAACNAVRSKCLELNGLAYGEPKHIWLDNLPHEWFVRFCEKCTLVASMGYRDGKAKFWNAVPSFFDLLPWENLQDFKE